MAEARQKRRWLRRLIVLAALVGVVVALRERQFARNHERYGPGPERPR